MACAMNTNISSFRKWHNKATPSPNYAAHSPSAAPPITNGFAAPPPPANRKTAASLPKCASFTNNTAASMATAA